MASASIQQRNQDATVYTGNLDDQVTEELLWELYTQVGVVVHVHMPKDKVTGATQVRRRCTAVRVLRCGRSAPTHGAAPVGCLVLHMCAQPAATCAHVALRMLLAWC